ncbi:unnamed protein product, partial [Prorocentrum cordatum]
EYFPVPEVQQLDLDIGFVLTRREKRRVRRLANDAIESLNWMHGARWREAGCAQPRLATFDMLAGLRRGAQRRAQLAAAGWRRSSSATSSQQALPQLMRNHGPYAEARANLASFVRDRLSIPEDVRRAPRVDGLLPDAALNVLKEYESCMLRPPEEVAALDETPGPVRPYADPVLKSNRKVYVGLVKRTASFHRLRFPKESKLDEYLACPEAWASELGLAWWEGRRVERGMVLYPLAQSLPMGWAWSPYVAREANARQMDLTKELRGAHLLQDRGPPLVLQGGRDDAGRGKYCYVDNLGLTVHETEVACECGVVLGIEVGGARGRTRPTAKRFWRARGSIQEVLRRGVCSGQELEVLVGHMTFVGLIRRELLSIPHGAYRLVKKLCYEKAPLCVKEEKAFCGAMVFLEAKWVPGVASPLATWIAVEHSDGGQVEWRREEGVIHLEARAVLKGIERLARSMGSTTTYGLKTGIKLASQTIKSMSETDERLKQNLDTESYHQRRTSRSKESEKVMTSESEEAKRIESSEQRGVERGAVGRSRTLAAAGERRRRWSSLAAEARLPARAVDAGSTVGDDEGDFASEEAATEADRKEGRLARQRAQRRVARVAERKTTMLLGQSYLKAAGVSEAGRVRCRSCEQELLDFADRESMALREDGEVGECLVARMNSRSRLGDRAERGECTVAALVFAFPNSERDGGRRAPRPLQGLRRWRMLCPNFGRRPLLWSAWAALAVKLVMNSEKMRWVGPVFAHLARGSSAERLFPRGHQQRGRPVRGAGHQALIPAVAHQAGHGGISLDRAFRFWPQEEAMKSRRWSSFRSTVRREKTGRLTEARGRWDPDAQAFALDCEGRLEDAFPRGAPLP